MIPVVNGKRYDFEHAGTYDGLFVMEDTETKTVWNHITGEAVYGKLAGSGSRFRICCRCVKQALNMDANMAFALSSTAFPERDNLSPDAQLLGFFVPTLGKEDTRRPRMDMGLGIWTNVTRRYYPLERIRQQGGAVIDKLDGRSVLVYLDPETSTPAALFVDAATATRQGNDVHLNDGLIVRSGGLLDRNGRQLPVERPQQIFTRWYGFSLTFPDPEIFGDAH